jgi:hypothetical protein
VTLLGHFFFVRVTAAMQSDSSDSAQAAADTSTTLSALTNDGLAGADFLLFVQPCNEFIQSDTLTNEFVTTPYP